MSRACSQFVASAPLIMDDTIENFESLKVYRKIIKEKTDRNNRRYYHLHYANVNPSLVPSLYPTNFGKIKIKSFARIRLGPLQYINGSLRNPLSLSAAVNKISRPSIHFLNAKAFLVFENYMFPINILKMPGMLNRIFIKAVKLIF